jgi:hypothetical protein
MKKTTLTMLILCTSLALPAQAGYEEGFAAYKRGDYVTALKEWRPLANAGNPIAQVALGGMYTNGHGVPLDKVLAYALFNLSVASDPSPNNPATRLRNTIVTVMTPREIEAGQALTRAAGTARQLRQGARCLSVSEVSTGSRT